MKIERYGGGAEMHVYLLGDSQKRCTYAHCMYIVCKTYTVYKGCTFEHCA